MSEETERYVVTVPIAGAMTVEVEVPAGADPDDIFDAALDAHAKRQEECDVEWEFHAQIVSGNVLYASTNAWSYEKVEDTE